MRYVTLLVALYFATASLLPPLRLFDRSKKEGSARGQETAGKDERPKPDLRPRKGDKGKVEAPIVGAFEVETLLNIAYRDDRDADPDKHKLDIFLPKGATDFPVLFFVHGGGWRTGNKELYSPIGQMFARNGVGAVVINYRLTTSKVKFPAHIEDVARAFAWVHGNIGRYGGRPDRIVLAGHSAGGHLVSLLATDEKYLKSERLSFADIRAVISMSGAYALDEIFGMYGSVFGRDRADRRDASPRYHVTTGHPPFSIIYADKDLPTIEKVSSEFYEDLKKVKCDVRIQKIANRTHISLILMASKDDDQTTLAMFDFLERQTEWRRPVIQADKKGGKP